MDDTVQSRISDAAAAASRKRRSSILKSQRPPRTPFCELEFNVCTPTDTTKSRRVSFSRRTGVAEFVTNEATTTWKNFYEEHNKSLESSGNDSGVNQAKQSIGHLGKRIFDQQFEEVDVFDLMGAINPEGSVSTSIGNINFPQQLERTDSKLIPPQNNFELSAFTEQSKFFGNDLAVTRPGGIFDNIDINMSAVKRTEVKDDLNEIEKDLLRQSKVCHGPFNGPQDLSEYIEVDLNMTHAAIHNDESDMSITSTIHSPKVQDITKSFSIDKKVSVDKDWVADKENIVINPYITPRESINFAINEEPEKVLVFDGKGLIVETEQPTGENYRQTLLRNVPEKTPQRKTLVLNCNDDLPNFIEDSRVSKNTSCFVVPEFKQSLVLDDMSITEPKLDETQNKHRTILFNDDLCNISVTQVVPNVISTEMDNRRTTAYENETSDVSITQAASTKSIDKEKRSTIVFDNINNGNISITQAVPANVVLCNSDTKTVLGENEARLFNIIQENTSSKRRTIMLEDGSGNVFIKQTIPSVIKESIKSRRTVVYEDKTGNISVTQLLNSDKKSSENSVLPENVRTVVFESDVGHVSLTQPLPPNIIILPQQLNATSYEDNFNISVTQAVPMNILLAENSKPNRRRTVVYEDATGNLSITQSNPLNQVIAGPPQQKSENTLVNNEVKQQANTGRTVVFESDDEDISMTQAVNLNPILPSNQNDDADISITRAVPMNQVIDVVKKQKQKEIDSIEATNVALHKEVTSFKRRTIVFENDDADISMTQAVPMNQVIDILNEQKQKETDNIQATNLALHAGEVTNKRRTIVFENEDADISMTRAVPMNQVIDILNEQKQKETDNIEATNLALHAGEVTNKRRTIVFENEDADISMTRAVPMNQVIDILNEQKQKETDNIEATNLALHAGEVTNKRRTIVFENEDADISMTRAVPMNQVIDILNEQKQKETDNIEATNLALHAGEVTNKRRTIVFENDDADISMTQAVSMNQVIDILNEQKQKETDNIDTTNLALHAGEVTNKRRTIVFENEDADISMTQMLNVNQVLLEQANEEKQNVTENDLQAATYAALHLQDKQHAENRMRSIMYDEDAEDISILQDEEVKLKSMVFEDVNTVLKNEDLFIEVDKFTEASQGNKEIETQDVSMAEVNEADSPRKTIAYEDDTNMSYTQAVLENLNPKALQDETLNDETANKMISKPIPTGLSSFQNDMLEKSYCKPVMERDDMLVNATNAICNVVVYQAGNVSAQKVRIAKTETSDSDTPITVKNEDETESTKIADEDTISSESKTTKDEKIDEQYDEQAELKSVCLSADNLKEPKECGIDGHPVGKSSVLNDLLDMSQTSFEDGIVDKNVMTNNTEHPVTLKTLPAVDPETDSIATTTSKESKRSVDIKSSTESKGPLVAKNSTDTGSSNDTLFFITKDSDEDYHTDISNEIIKKTSPNLKSSENSHSVVKHADKKGPGILKDVHKKLSSIKRLLKGQTSPINHYLKEHLEPDPESLEESETNIPKKQFRPNKFKMANDTKELLDMISDITDKPLSNLRSHLEENQSDLRTHLEEDKSNFTHRPLSAPRSNLEEDQEIPEPILVRGHLALENKEEITERRRLGFVSKRQSIALSREDLLNNLSMAGAALQKSRFELDDSETCDDDTVKETPLPEIPHKKSLRLSKEVIKTLHFEGDDSVEEITEEDKSNQATPLKKTAFGEISYMTDTKSKVIPTYMNASNGIKELIDDLVKPMADVLPFQTPLVERDMKRVPSTCSTQIQANLSTSSQVDLHIELQSMKSTCEVSKHNFTETPRTNASKPRSRPLGSPIKSAPTFPPSDISYDTEMTEDTRTRSRHHGYDTYGNILVFDHNNPLNNVFLAPPVAMEIHRYNPTLLEEKQSEKSLADSSETVIDKTEKGSEQENVTAQFCIETTFNQSPKTVRVRSPEPFVVTADTQSQISNVSLFMSDQCTESKNNDLKDTECNTVIAMKVNKELLDASSSLTLVDDAIVRSPTNPNADSRSSTSLEDESHSPLQLIYKLNAEPYNQDSDLTDIIEKCAKPKKRFYSPTKRDKHKHCTLSSLESSPVYKMQKRSLSPNCRETSMKVTPEKERSPNRDSDTDDGRSTTTSRRSPRKQFRKPGTAITVQQMMTMVHVEDREQENQFGWPTVTDTIKEESPEELEDNSSVEPRSPTLSQSEVQNLTSSELVTSFTSSKKMLDDISSSGSPGLSRIPSRKLSKVDWTPESDSDGLLKQQMVENPSATNIITRIDMMPFMGSHDCEWESSAGDTWSFLLLHARLRLTVQFRRKPRFAPDSPVLNVGLETLDQDKKNPIATLCVKYAAEVMRFYISRGCGAAGDVPKLVRRLAAAARLAARWARAMHDARARLAYTLTPDGWLELKVANTYLRTVWEVTLQLELVVDDARSAPWPRACGVRVARVLSAGAAPRTPGVARLLGDTPGDWGHAPRTVWKIFRYLKSKKCDDDIEFQA